LDEVVKVIMKDGLELKDVVLLGRTFAEYKELFRLDDLDLSSERILDMSAGVGSFCAEATERGYNVTSADPIYNFPTEEIASKSAADLQEVIRQFPEVSHKYNWKFYRDIDGLRRYREEAYQRFLKHYPTHRSQYVTATLPHTPFQNNQFSLTLVSHFLFLYEDRFNYEFHKRSLLELVRITEREIRIYPLTTLKAEKSSFIDQLINDKDCSMISFTIAKSNFEFLKNSDELLVIQKKSSNN
jgi:hypothetical protein